MFEALLLSCLLFQSGSESSLDSQLISSIPARNISFAGTGTRMGEVAVFEKDPKIFYIASCNGGVLKTKNAGITTEIVFDKIGSCSIGSLTVSQTNPDVLWVGTGDKFQRNSVGLGDGIYKTTDGGKTWEDMGLKNSVCITRIAIDPKNENTVMVAVAGSVYGYGPDRGVYKTTDGGKNWRKVLYTNEKSGASDVVIDPKNPKNMLAGLWDHIHYPYGWYYGGPGSGIYRSTDGGETWHRAKGLPADKVGRIFIGYFPKDPKLAAAFVEEDQPHKRSGFYRSWDGGETWKMMPGYDPKEKKQHEWARAYYCDNRITFDSNNPDIIYIGGAGQKTTDGGKTITGSTSEQHGSWVNPNDPKHIINSGDGGASQMWDFTGDWGKSKTHMSIATPCFFQTYGCGYDMRKLYWVMGNAQDDGAYTAPSQSRRGVSDGSDTLMIFGHEAGRSMADPEDWTTIYAQGPFNHLERVDLKTHTKKKLPVPEGRHYDGFNDKPHPKVRINRFPPFEISPWNSKTLYFGLNMLAKSTDRGDHWEIISPDLTHDKPEWQVRDEGDPRNMYEYVGSGDKCYQTINTISESPLKQNMIWIGTDDGYVWLTKDGGKNWDNLTKNISGLPEYSWCSRIEASKFVEGRAYATFDNHRWYDHKTYIYVTEDFGQTWAKINGNMKDEPCRVIKEGLKNPDLLFVGTEFGLWATLDRGKTWNYYQDWECPKMTHYLGLGRKGYLPRVAVHDLQIHPRENDLIVGTHGRGIYIMPIKPLEEMTAENRAKDVYFTEPGNLYLFPLAGTDGYVGVSAGENSQPGTLIAYYLKQDAKGKGTIKFQDALGNEILKWNDYGGTTLRSEKYEIKDCPTKAGLNTIQWINPDLIKKPGDYRIVLTIDGKEYTQKLHVEDATDEILPGTNSK